MTPDCNSASSGFGNISVTNYPPSLLSLLEHILGSTPTQAKVRNLARGIIPKELCDCEHTFCEKLKEFKSSRVQYESSKRLHGDNFKPTLQYTRGAI